MDVEMAAKGEGKKGKTIEREKCLYYAGTKEEEQTEDAADHQKQEESEQQSEGAADDARWLRLMML